jgi:hypothetical protein
MELLYRALLDTSEIFTGLDKIEARFKNINIATLDLKIRGLQEASADVTRLQDQLKGLNAAGTVRAPRVATAPVLVPDTAIQAQINAQIVGLQEVSNSAKASASVFRSAQEEEKFAALQNRDAIHEVQLALTRTRTEFDKQHGQAATWQEERDAVIAYQQAINGVTASIQQLNTRQDLTLTQARTLSNLEGQIARQQASLEGKVNPLGLSGNVANAIRAAGLNAPLPAGGSLGAASAASLESTRAADAALAHLNTTYAAGRIELADYRAALAGLNIALTADITETELEIKLLTELNALDAAQSARLTELTAQQRAYAESIIATTRAQTSAAAEAKAASVGGQLNRGFGAGGLNGAALGLSFASPALGLAATAASFGPETVAIAGVGLAVAGTAKLFLDGAQKAAVFQQQLGQINALSHVGTAAINDYGKYVKQVGQDLGISTTDLNEFGRQAVLVGLDSAPGLKTFTKGMSELKVILRDVHGETPGLEELGQETVKILHSMGQSSEQVNANFGSTINSLVALKTQFGVAIPDVAQLATYFSSYASTIGLTTDQILAFSASLVSVGARAQGSGSQLTKFFEKAAAASATGGAPLKAFASALGLSTDATQVLLKTDSAKFLQQFAARLGELHAQGVDSGEVLKSLGLNSAQAARAFNELSVASINTQKALDVAKKGLQDTGLSARIAAEATSSYPDQVKKLGVAFDNLKIGAGVLILPFLKDVVGFLTGLVTSIDGLVNDSSKLRTFFTDAVGYIGPATVALLAFKGQLLLTKLSLFSFTPQSIYLIFGSIVTGFEAATLAAKAFVASIPIVGVFAVAASALAEYANKIISDTNSVRDATDRADAAAGDSLLQQVAALRKTGTEVDRIRAQILLARQAMTDAQQGAFTGTDLAGNRSFKVDPELIKSTTARYKELLAEQVKITTEYGRHQAASGAAAAASIHHAQGTSAAYGTLSDKLITLNGTYTEVKTTAFEGQLNSARKTLEAFNKEVDKALALGEKGRAGGITPEEAKTLRDRAAAVAARDVADITAQQHTKDLDTAASNEQAIQSARLAVIKDARVKREAEYQNEVTTLQRTYGKSIREALTNARTPGLDPASRAQLLRDAGVVQQQLAQAEEAALAKRNQDLSNLDDARAKKLRDAGTQGLALLATESDARTKILSGERDRALQLAGSSVTGRLAVEERYGPALEQQQEAARQLQLRAEQAKLRNELADALSAADDQGTATAGLKLAAQQDFNTKSRTLDSIYMADINKFRLDAEKTLADARLVVFTAALDKELALVKDFNGKQLDAEVQSLRARRAAAVAAGDVGKVEAIDKGLTSIQTIKSDNLVKFRDELKKSTTTATDLRVQLDNIAQTPLQKALSGAASPFNSILKTALDTTKSLNTAFGKLGQDQQTGPAGAALKGQLDAQNRIILDANQRRNQALLTARQDYDRQLSDKAAAAAAQLAKTQFDGQKIGEGVYTTLLDADRQYWTHRLAVAVKGSADEDAVRQKLADNQAERDRARQVILARQLDARTLNREELDSSLKLAKSDEARAAIRQQLGQADQNRLGVVTAELAGLRANGGKVEDIAKLERERLDLLGKINDAHNTERQLTETLLKSQQGLIAAEGQRQAALARTNAEVAASKVQAVTLAGGDLADVDRRIALARQEGDTTASINDLLTERQGKVISLYQAQRDAARYGIEVSQQQLDLDEARVRAVAKITGAANDAVASAQTDLDVTRKQLANIDDQLSRADDRKLTEAEINALQVKRLDLIGQEAEQFRKVVEAERQRRDLIDSANLGASALSREATGGSPGNRVLSDAQGSLNDTRTRLAEATRAYGEAQAALSVRASTTLNADGGFTQIFDGRTTANIQKFGQAQDALTAQIANQRKALEGLATAYRDQLSSMDSVRDATDKLRAGAQTNQPAGPVDVSLEFERLTAIQARRDQALQKVQDAIRSGDAKLIASSTQELTAQQDRYNKQADLIGKSGVQVTRQGDGAVADVLKQLDRLGISYDQEAVNLQKRASAADKEAEAAVTFGAATATLPQIFSTGAQQIQDAIFRGVDYMIQSASRLTATASVSPTAPGNTYRGGDTITYQIENNIYPSPGQQLGLDDVTRAVNQGIDDRIGTARRAKAWTKDC